ncbi:PQQ-binding-like beta-propeller repeat protein [Haloarcula onubensis]|uniref:PQQ-binding-like beta-propeller repeat protein n=1 Tax=Haloarcula onubensis TaxID=2950539 RepID=A0ABU2FJK3_9EURY|nr:PQQ-binding-like beta-propeller repeat protein [Halomicroarcula sp. S3CR25-11]MDS0280511.1 PQQ-binding-like beta-propeller repeat protein [Halomicroarcula sp. S3CR25-11]
MSEKPTMNRRQYVNLSLGLLAVNPVIDNGVDGVQNKSSSGDEPLNWSAIYNDSANTGELSPQAGLTETPDVRWQRTVGDSVGAASFMIVHEGVAVLAPYSGGRLTAVDRADGETVWSKDVNVRNPMAAAGDKLFAAFGENDTVGAFSLADGSILWDAEVGSYTGGVSVGGDSVFQQGTEAVRAFDTDSGDLLWSVREDRRASGGVNGIAPAYHDGFVYAPAANYQTLLALNAETGETVWETEELPNGNYNRLHTPVIVNDVVLMQDGDTLYCIEQSTGERRWVYSSGRGKTNPVTDGEEIYISDSQEGILNLDFDTGDATVLVEGRGGAPLTVGADNIYYNDEFALFAYDKQSGEEVWSLEKEGRTGTAFDESPLIVLDGSAFYYDDGQFTKLSTGTGSSATTSTPADSVPSTAVTTEPSTRPTDASGPGYGAGTALFTAVGSLFVGNWLRMRHKSR